MEDVYSKYVWNVWIMESWIMDVNDHLHLEGAFVSLFRSNSSSNYETQPAPPRFVNYMDSVSVASASDMLNGTCCTLRFLWGFWYGFFGCDGEGPKQETVSRNIMGTFFFS